MAIRRCPYCKAIIDEQDKYCNNCGTQLLFPEDEFVEEAIPGDKIVDEDETTDVEKEEKKLEKGEEREGTEALEEEAAEDEEELDELEGKETEEEDDSEELEELEEEKKEDEEEVEEAGELEEQEELDEPQKKYEVSIEEDELVFKTKELDSLTGTVDEEKEKLEPASTTKDVLPPWASGMKEAPPLSGELDKREGPETKGEIETGKTPTRPEWTIDSGIGIPEKVTQAALPFDATAVPATGRPIEEMAGEEEKEVAGTEIRRRTGFSLKLKSKLVDLVFITALWLITLLFTAQVIGVSFLRVIAGSPVPVLALYFILILLYFFLFLYFLGETLGDHYFPGED